MHGPNDLNERMIREQIEARGVSDSRVLEALRSVPRDLFVPESFRSAAFDDSPQPLPCGQTISQPYIVGWMTQLLRVQPDDTVLELGAGSGYQTAILARLARTVYSAELEPDLARTVRARLEQLGITNVTLEAGDGVHLFRRFAPFNAILSAAAPLQIPDELVDQLADGGRMVIPAGPADMQFLWLLERKGGQVVRRQLEPVRFVPLR